MSKKIKKEIIPDDNESEARSVNIKKEKIDEDEDGIDPLENVEVDMDLSHLTFGHSIFDHNMRTFKCRECMMIFPNQHLLYHHQQKSHYNQVKPQFQVDLDKTSFGKFKCSYCTSQFSSAPSLKSHISRVHMCKSKSEPMVNCKLFLYY